MFLRWLTYLVVLIIAQGYVFPQGISRNKRSSDEIPCQYGWYYFKATEKCYRIAENYRSWPDAEKECTKLESNLVTIETRAENDFLVGLILLQSVRHTWIGLNDRSNEGVYEWQSGSKSEYRNWKDGEPWAASADGEDCIWIVMDIGMDQVGVWNDMNCGSRYGYICEKNSDSALSSPDLRYCSHNQDVGFRYRSSCYHPVTELKTWEEAEQHCIEQYGGHLITVLDKIVDYFLTYVSMGNNSDVWTGLKIREQYQQKWSSGWYVGYEPSNKGSGYSYGTCVVRTELKKWNIVSCSRKYAFICEKSPGKIPVLKSTVKDSYCPSKPAGWRDLGGEFCYFIETEKDDSWVEANFECMRRGANLASIHSQEEADILRTFTNGFRPLIGLFRKEDNTFGWTDGSKLDFLNWYPTEPNNVDEKCVEAADEDTTWNDMYCTRKDRRAYICAVKKITPNIALATNGKPKHFISATPNMTISTTEKLQFNSSVAPSIKTTLKPEFDSSGNIYKNVLIGVVVFSVSFIILLGVVIYYFCRKITEHKKNSSAVCFQPSAPAVPPRKYRSSRITIDEEDYYYEDMDK